MRKMTTGDIDGIVDLLKKWKRLPLYWDGLRQQISVTLLAGEKSWSRQSLQSNESIKVAWLTAKRRLVSRGAKQQSVNSDESTTVVELESALTALQIKYDNLAMRHRQLIYNASMLPGGTRLLLDPLPDNTPVQKLGAGPKPRGRTRST